MSKQKKGFTLIELMVVIVIIGILAAIAIPKLFGMTSKAKASEVSPAAGTWSKLQQAYALDANALGSFARIGYTPPGTKDSSGTYTSTDFKYSGTPTSGEDSTGTATWKAELVNTKLGDCAKSDGIWELSVSFVAEQGAQDATVTLPKGDECQALTANFKNLGTVKAAAANP